MILSGLVGETHIGDSVWVVKTHNPIASSNKRDLPAHKIICCTRNPFDTFTSLFNMNATMVHTSVVEGDYLGELKEEYEAVIKKYVSFYKKVHDMYIKYSVEQNAFVYYLRYEDLLETPKETFQELMTFILGVDSIEGTNAQRRIDEVFTSGDIKNCKTYEPKTRRNLNNID